jgi:hypothetical protein
MHKIRFAGMIILGMLGIALAVQIPASALNPYYPTADAYTDLNDTSFNSGMDTTLLLYASNAAGCIPTSYLWYKFSIPATASTIGDAYMYMRFTTAGSGTMDLMLGSSTDTSWLENDPGGITWDTQPVTDTLTLATAASVAPGGEIVFNSPNLTSYLNNHRGQTVSLVVRANCNGTVSINPTRNVNTKENGGGSGVRLELFNPTAIKLVSLTAGSNNPPVLWALLIISALAGFALFGLLFMRRARNH